MRIDTLTSFLAFGRLFSNRRGINNNMSLNAPLADYDGVIIRVCPRPIARGITYICEGKEKVKRTRRAGFSLIEAIVVLSIISAAVISIPPMLQWLRQQGIRHALEQLQCDLQLARMIAIRQKQSCTLRFNTPGRNQYTNTANNRSSDLGAYRGDVHFLGQGPDGRKMAAEVNFNRQGMSATVEPAYIFLSNGGNLTTYRIQVLLPGGISVERWNGNGWN